MVAWRKSEVRTRQTSEGRGMREKKAVGKWECGCTKEMDVLRAAGRKRMKRRRLFITLFIDEKTSRPKEQAHRGRMRDRNIKLIPLPLSGPLP